MNQKSSSQRTQFIMMFFAFAFGMILSNLLTQYSQDETNATEPKEILFIYRGIEKYHEDLVPEDRDKLTGLAIKKQQIVENAALRQFLLDEAYKTNQTLEQIINTTMPRQAVTESEIEEFYEQNKASLDKPLAIMSPEIRKHLENQRLKNAKQGLLNELIEKGDLALLPES